MFAHSVRRGAVADIRSVDTSQSGRDLETHSPPTDHTHPPSRQSECAGVCGRSWLLWQHTPVAAPSGPLPPVSSLGGNRDSALPEGSEDTDYSGQFRNLCRIKGTYFNMILQILEFQNRSMPVFFQWIPTLLKSFTGAATAPTSLR